MLGNNSIDMLMAARGGYRNESGAIIFPQSKKDKELEETKKEYQELSEELESKLRRVDALLEKLEK